MAIAQRPLKVRVIPPAAIRYVGTAKLQSAWYWNKRNWSMYWLCYTSLLLNWEKMAHIWLLELTDAPIAILTIAIMNTIRPPPPACFSIASAIFYEFPDTRGMNSNFDI